MGTSTVDAALSNHDLLTVVSQVWHTRLGHEAQDSQPIGPPSMSWTLSAVVGINDAWPGHLRVDCGPDAAALIAHVLDGPETDRPDNDRADAIGMFATIVAGSITAYLPAPTSLCLPVVATGGTQHLRLPHCREANRVLMAWRHESVQVRLFQAEPATSAHT